jgi:WD40 repeat protein
MVTASGDRTIKLWKRTGELLKSVDTSAFIKEIYMPVDSVAFTRNKQYVVGTTTSGDTLLVDVAKGTITKLATGEAGLGTLSLDPTDTLFVVAKGSLSICSLATGKLLFAWSDPRQGVWDVTFSANNKLMASLGTDGILRLWGVVGNN